MKYGLQDIGIGKKDYILGSNSSLPKSVLVESGQWGNWLPKKEVQDFPIETDSCVTFAILNAVEILLRYEFVNTEDLSDRFLAYITGTGSKHGNNPQIVAEALRTKGDVKESEWPYTAELKTWEDIYTTPPQKLYAEALSFVSEYGFGHEWVPSTPEDMKQALKYSPLTVAGWAWSMNDKGLYYSPPSKVPEHYFVIYGYVDGEYWEAFDSYNNSIKRLAWNFHFTMVKRFTLHTRVETNFLEALLVISERIILFIKGLMKKKEKVVIKNPTPTAPNNLVKFATALRDFEGKPGDLNYINNNPGNFRCSRVGYLKKYRDVRCRNNFAVFPTYQQGWNYLLNSINQRVKKHPTWTFYDFFKNYAPEYDNNPTISYATFVANRCGVTINTKLITYF